ncbi:hypothetical protein LAWASA_4429 [Lawsonibacter asaccharolyticus]|nr:hypothetical protein LAWASA_105 [Lawsonibacter asaccharolyticus]GBF71669.1 hypothetical protein LAWASA_4429 [Lawsonibacter asaccharolyticus]
MKKLENMLEWGGTKKEIAFLVISGLALVANLLHVTFFGFNPVWIAIILCGVPIILEAIIGLVTAFDIKADVLVSIALIASICIGEYFAAGEVAFIMQLGALLEDLTVAKARAGIEKLVHLTPQTARVLRDEKELIIPAEKVQVGDILRVLPGESIPVDGMILSGQTSVNQAVMTGESMPVDKTVGDEVSSGTVNQFGTFEMKATKVGEDSSIQRMIRLVQSADAGKAKIVGIADKWATWIVVIALAAAALAWLVTEEIGEGCTVIYILIDDVLAGIIVLSDTLREESAQMIKGLGNLGVQPVLLTGDNENAAEFIAKQLQIKEIRANCMPEDKLNYIEHAQTNDTPICMIGDGVNDAPALKKAFVGIAMGGVGSDIAVDAADIALVNDEVKELPHLIALSKRMMKTIKINLSFSMGLNFLAIILALEGVLNPVVGALVHNAGSVLVIINSALLLKWRKRDDLKDISKAG